jgi:hypothetical protein
LTAFSTISANSGRWPTAWHWVKGPKTVNHPHQVGLGELLSMASTRLRGEVGGPIGLTKPTNKKLLVALLLRPAIML